MTRTNRECITFIFFFLSQNKKKLQKNIPRGRAGIEPATSRTRSENHTSRPTARVASIEVRTRDLLLTRQMLCQLSYRGGVIMYRGAKTFPEPFCGALRARDKKKLLTLTPDGIRTRNPQIRSLMRYPLRHGCKSNPSLLAGNSRIHNRMKKKKKQSLEGLEPPIF